MVDHKLLPVFELKGTSKRELVGLNESGKKMIKLVDTAQRLFPEQSHVIRTGWSNGYRTNGNGFRKVIDHLEQAVLPHNRTADQQSHLEQMNKFRGEVWPDL